MNAPRFAQIGWAAMGLLCAAEFERLRKVQPAASDLPRRLRAMLERLGPAFVKLGQALSLRPRLELGLHLLEAHQVLLKGVLGPDGLADAIGTHQAVVDAASNRMIVAPGLAEPLLEEGEGLRLQIEPATMPS